jgi:hypothetical protein
VSSTKNSKINIQMFYIVMAMRKISNMKTIRKCSYCFCSKVLTKSWKCSYYLCSKVQTTSWKYSYRLCSKVLTKSWIYKALAHWNNNQRVDMSLHSDTLFWFRTNQSLLSLGNRKCKYARFFAIITGKMLIIKHYQLY